MRNVAPYTCVGPIFNTTLAQRDEVPKTSPVVVKVVTVLVIATFHTAQYSIIVLFHSIITTGSLCYLLLLIGDISIH